MGTGDARPLRKTHPYLPNFMHPRWSSMRTASAMIKTCLTESCPNPHGKKNEKLTTKPTCIFLRRQSLSKLKSSSPILDDQNSLYSLLPKMVFPCKDPISPSKTGVILRTKAPLQKNRFIHPSIGGSLVILRALGLVKSYAFDGSSTSRSFGTW